MSSRIAIKMLHGRRPRIGVGTMVEVAPPSEPDWRISRISALQLVVIFHEDRQAARYACLKENKPIAEK